MVAVAACGHVAPPPAPVAGPPAAPFVWQLPPGVPTPTVPVDNQMSTAKVELGRRLFYDTRLSGNRSYSCGSCHQQARAFTDGLAHAVGSTGAAHARSAMALANVGYNVTFGWADPSLRTLEDQAAVPMFNEHPVELGLKGRESEVVDRLRVDANLVALFVAAFPTELSPATFPNVIKAIAAFERTLVSGDSPFDRYLYRDDHAAISAAAGRGMTLFFSKRLRCSECHASFNLSGPVRAEGAKSGDPEFHNTGLYNVDGRGGYPAGDRGLIERTGRASDMGRFRAPTLRNIAVTAPYMHDGSLPTLESVIAHYAAGGVRSRLKSERLKGFHITPEETADLIEFLKSLTDSAFLTNPALGPLSSALH